MLNDALMLLLLGLVAAAPRLCRNCRDHNADFLGVIRGRQRVFGHLHDAGAFAGGN